jgi:regulator of sigma E protease
MNGFLWNLLAFVIILSPLIFLHELGHYLVARAFNVHIHSFSIGMGPELIGWTNKLGTRWKISLFPLGGYVKMADLSEEGSTIPPQQTMQGKKPWQKIVIAAAGPFANYGIAFGLFISLFTLVGKPLYPAKIGSLAPESLAERSGLVQGDFIQSIGSKEVKGFEEFVDILKETPASQPLEVCAERGGALVYITIDPQSTEGVWLGKLGVQPDISAKDYQKLSLSESIVKAGQLLNPLQSIKSLKLENMGGPVMIAQQAGQVLTEGWMSILLFMAAISAALGFFNLIPIPLLDGGVILFSAIEMIIRRPLSERIQKILTVFSVGMLGTLFVWLFWKDLMKIPLIQGVVKNFLPQ